MTNNISTGYCWVMFSNVTDQDVCKLTNRVGHVLKSEPVTTSDICNSHATSFV